MNIYSNNSNSDNPWEFLKQFFNETLHQMIHQLASVNMDILTEGDVGLTNQIIPDVETLRYYHLTFIPARNQTVHAHISNNRFHNINLQLDNSKISAHISNNVFIGAGIKISSTFTDFHEPVIIENCIFQGVYSKTIIEVSNTTNVYLYSCLFNNSKLGVLPAVDDNEESGIFCFNGQIELRNVLFKTVSFFPVAAFENCSLAIYQITMSGNSVFNQATEKKSLLYLKYSEAIIEDGKIEGNTQVHCFWVFGGNITLHNVLFSSNNKVEYGRFMQATVNITNNSVLNNMDSSFHISQASVSFSSCKFINDSNLRNHDSELLFIFESYVTIVDCVLKEVTGNIDITGSELFIRGSNFLLNINYFFLINFSFKQLISEPSLHILYCRFESNEPVDTELNSRLINVGSGSAVIEKHCILP